MELSELDELKSRYEKSLASMNELAGKLESAAEKFETVSGVMLTEFRRQFLTLHIAHLESEPIGDEKMVANASQPLDSNVPTVAQQSARLGLELIVPNRHRGTYVGPMLAFDSRAILVKFCATKTIEVPFSDLSEDQVRPRMGDLVRLDYKNGELTVTVEMSERNARRTIE